MTDTITRELGGELVVRSEEERIVEARLLRWDDVATIGRMRERVTRGAFRRGGTDPAAITLEAIGPHGAEPGVRLAGRAIGLEERDDGPYASLRVSRTAAGDELLELVRDGVYRNVSIVAEPIAARTGSDGVVERTALRLVRVGVVELGAYQGANVLAVRSADVNENETPNPTPDPEPEPTPTPPAARVAVIARTADNAGDLDALRDELVGRMTRLEARGGAPSTPIARFRSLVELWDASYSDPDTAPLLARALADQITTDNPGVMGSTIVGDVQGILARPRAAITALGGARGLGASGMTLDYPYLDPALDLDTVVAKQLAEKTEIASVKVKLLKGSNPIDTFAGGSDVSYQLIRRSSPAYREAYLRILAIAYARATEAEFETDLEAGAGSTAILAPDADANAYRGFLFEASSLVEDATGSPATVDLVSPTEFVRIGGLRDLAPPQYGTSNISGLASASTLRIEVSGLPVIRAPFLTGATHIVTNGEAAGWHEDGPFPISAEDVAKLGQNIAVWGMGATAIPVPKGVVKSSATAARSGSSSKG
jgi:HK97 family phage prohead protease